MRLVKRLFEGDWFGQACARTPLWLVDGTEAALRYSGAVLRRPITLKQYDMPVEGGGEGAAGRLIVADHGQRVPRLFQDEWDTVVGSEQPLERVRWQRIPAALDRRAGEADLLIARFHARLARRRFTHSYLAVPEAVESVVEVPADGSVPQHARRGQSGNLRLLRKAGLHWAVSHRDEDFARFYHEMYAPFAQARFGCFANTMGYQQLRQHFLRGGLMWILEGDRQVAGAVWGVEAGALVSYVGGTASGDLSLIKKAVTPAMDVFSFELAHRLGVHYYNMGMSRPVLNDGVLNYKKRWGAGVRAGQLTYCNYYLRWDRFNPLVARLLNQSPLLMHDGDGLSGLAAVARADDAADEPLAQLATTFAMPGLRRLFVMTPGVERVQSVRLDDERLRELDICLVPPTGSAALAAEMARRSATESGGRRIRRRRWRKGAEAVPVAAAP